MSRPTSAGLLLYRLAAGAVEVLLVHPGGPFWAKKDTGAWSIPKGEVEAGEALLEAARRELREETGFEAEGSEVLALGQVRQRGGKTVHAWALRGDADPGALVSSTFEMEWPPRSGRIRSFPEVDRAAWFDLTEARRRIHPAQAAFLDTLADLLAARRELNPPGERARAAPRERPLNRLLRFPSSVKHDPAIDQWMRERTGPLGAIAQRWFEVMRACGDDVRELLHDGHPTACVEDAAFAYVNAFKAHVNVGFFRGTELADPEGLLIGTGRFMRHVKLSPERDLDATALETLIETAYVDMVKRLRAT